MHPGNHAQLYSQKMDTYQFSHTHNHITCKISIDEHLSFNEHTCKISYKANAINAFLQRNIKSFSPKVKEICYKVMVRPIVEYACTVWAPCTRKNIQSLEAAQRKAAWFVKIDLDLPQVLQLCCRIWGGLHLKKKMVIEGYYDI